MILKDYSLFRIDINIISFLIVFQLNSIIACYVCVQLIKFICMMKKIKGFNCLHASCYLFECVKMIFKLTNFRSE